ncbi:GTP 3',8-cyclase MoaA [Thermocrinis sp.]|uniref:GTP 3',8-cyclase MoaA n=1 Tax=Thermocrinis sp. TaxID=2024383 RepID=UPI002608CFB4|nr:GTP 3',8-cyclase MoaA [Thermocrinis sp.]
MPIDQLGRELKDLRVSVTDRCNFRCWFCMPEGEHYEFFKREEILSFEEIARVVRIVKGLGVKKVRLTGGEPLLRRHLEKLVALISQEVEDIALTTNGFLLKDKLQDLALAGLKRVTVSLPSLRDQTLSKLVGRDVKVGQILEGIHRSLELGLSVKVNVCVVRDINDDEILEFIEFFRPLGVEVRFIEFMDVGTLNGWSLERVFSAKDIINAISQRYRVKPIGRRKRGETAERFMLEDGYKFGIIASVTQPFCGECNRLRLTADGKLFTCLFASDGYDLKSLLRGGARDEEIRDFIVALWEKRKDRYSEERLELLEKGIKPKKVEMFKLGG